MKYSLTDNPLKTSIAWNLFALTGLFTIQVFYTLAKLYLAAGTYNSGNGIGLFVALIRLGGYFPIIFSVFIIELIFKIKLKFKLFTQYKFYNFIFYPLTAANILLILLFILPF